MTHDQIREDLPLFALGSLDAEERRAVEQHLAAGCAECERELGAWGEVVGSIALKDAPAAAPRLKEKLLERAGAAPRRARVIALPSWAAAPLALAAGAVLVLGIARDRLQQRQLGQQAAQAATLQQQLGSARQDFAKVSAELRAKENDLAALRVALASAEGTIELLRRPGLQLVRLGPTKDQPTGQAHVLMSERAGRAVFYAFDLPQVAPDKTYELWWITEKEGPVNAGLFKPDPQGLGRVETGVPESFGAIKAAAVTIEPAAGVSKPTGPMVLLGEVRAL